MLVVLLVVLLVLLLVVMPPSSLLWWCGIGVGPALARVIMIVIGTDVGPAHRRGIVGLAG